MTEYGLLTPTLSAFVAAVFVVAALAFILG